MTNSNYALVGAAGYVAPRHMKAIKDTGGSLVASFDPNDSVGILDSYFPQTRFFTEFERFDRYIHKLKREGRPIDFVSICSPNYLHDSHIRFALRSGCTAICEKPLVLNPWNIDALEEISEETGQEVYSILQLRLHPAINALRGKLQKEAHKIHDVDLTYIAARGGWYHVSWKGEEKKSGGVATNIGVHFFDMLQFVFGKVITNEVHLRDAQRTAGYMELERARVRWFLSVDSVDLPKQVHGSQTTYRSITIDGDEIEFSGGFTDLHTLSYQHILDGRGFTMKDVRPSIELVAKIRTEVLKSQPQNNHPFTLMYVK
jgi:UDP-N-acetyl-2-amino-2-deoxyglucuronate dehydrogenase